MNKNRLVFYGIFGGYQFLVFLFTVLVDGHLDLLGLIPFISWFKYIAFFGFLLMVADFAYVWFDSRKVKKEHDDLRLENNTLKAKVYDLQEKEKNTQPVSRT